MQHLYYDTLALIFHSTQYIEKLEQKNLLFSPIHYIRVVKKIKFCTIYTEISTRKVDLHIFAPTLFKKKTANQLF